MRRHNVFRLVGTLLFVVAALGLWFAYASSRTLPPQVFPATSLPHPNAWDFYIQAGLATNEQMARVWVPGGKLLYGSTLPPSEKQAVVKRNARALAIFQQGLKYPCVVPAVRGEFFHLMPASRIRSIARINAMKADILGSHGDFQGAMVSRLDGIQLGIDTEHGANVFSSLLAISVQEISRAGAWSDLQHLDARDAASDARRMEALNASQVPYVDIMREDRWNELSMRAVELASPHWDTKMADRTVQKSDELHGTSLWLARAELRAKLLVCGPQKIYDETDNYKEQFVEAAKFPYVYKVPVKHVPLDPATEYLDHVDSTDSFDFSIRLVDTIAKTENALLCVRLALQSYYADNGHYPKSLQALVGKYLHRLPDDPFGRGGALPYKTIGRSMVLYSVGPDGRDDGGMAIPNSPSPIGQHYSVKNEDNGDIVAGITTR